MGCYLKLPDPGAISSWCFAYVCWLYQQAKLGTADAYPQLFPGRTSISLGRVFYIFRGWIHGNSEFSLDYTSHRRELRGSPEGLNALRGKPYVFPSHTSYKPCGGQYPQRSTRPICLLQLSVPCCFPRGRRRARPSGNEEAGRSPSAWPLNQTGVGFNPL